METHKRTRENFHKEQCLSFVEKLWQADRLAMFHHPVSATEVPGYFDVIKSPIDLSTIRGKIEAGEYDFDTSVQDDVALMISNALEFNESGTEWHNQAKQLRKRYLDMAQQSGLAVDADAAFIPARKARDDESTLRKAEAKYAEKLDNVLGDLEKEKAIPIEELRKLYSRTSATTKQESSDDEDDDGDAGSGSTEKSTSEESDSVSSGSSSEDDEESESDDAELSSSSS